MSADFIAGWTSGGLSLLFAHPLDTIKARLQTTNNYKGIVDCALKTVRYESFFGLYKGMLGPMLSTGALNSILFTGYGIGLRLLHPSESNVEARKELPLTDIMFASMVGSTMQILPVIPIELVKTRLQVQTANIHRGVIVSEKQYAGVYDCIRKTVRHEGLRGLFKGGPTIFFRDQIGYLFYIPVYEVLLRSMRRRDFNDYFAQFFSGGAAGVSCWLSICPLEIVKNRVQIDNTGRRKMLEVAREIYKEDGLRAFFRGGLTLSIRGFCVNSILFIIYEKVFVFVNSTQSDS